VTKPILDFTEKDRIMGPSRWYQLPRAKSRPTALDRRGRVAVRPRLEGLETRFMPAVFSGIVGGQLQVTDTSAVDIVTLDHSGSTTFINEAAFPDTAIPNGIQITVGTGVGHFDTVNIRATALPVTVDGQFDIGTLNLGTNGSVQEIPAPIFVTELNGKDVRAGHVILDDSADPVGRDVSVNVVNGLCSVDGLAPASINITDDGIEPLDIRGGPGGNTFTIRNAPNNGGGFFSFGSLDLFAGSGNDTVNVLRNPGHSDVAIHGQGGHDTVRLGNNGSVQELRDLVEIDNDRGVTDLVVDDSADAIARDVTIDHFLGGLAAPELLFVHGLAPAEIQYKPQSIGTANFRLGRGGNTITFDDFLHAPTGRNQTILDTGTGNDVVKIRDTRDGVIVNGQNGRDTVSIGSDDLPGGSMTGILGGVLVTNTGSFTSLLLNDTVDTAARIVTLDVSGTIGLVTGLSPAPITYRVADLGALDVRGGEGADTFFVRATQGIAQPTINAGLGDDTLVVGSAGLNLDTIQSALTVNGGGGFDRLVVQDQGSHVAHTYTTTVTQVRRISESTPTVIVNYAAIDSLQVNKGGPTTIPPPLVKGLTLPKSVRAGKAATLTGRLIDPDGDKKLTLTVD
jgi:hypothetical protein